MDGFGRILPGHRVYCVQFVSVDESLVKLSHGESGTDHNHDEEERPEETLPPNKTGSCCLTPDDRASLSWLSLQQRSDRLSPEMMRLN